VAGREELMARYSADVAELVLPDEAPATLPAFITELQSLPWVSGVSSEGALLRVTTNDPTIGREALLPLVVKHNLPMLRYEWMRPNLEEIFLSRTEAAS
jgi:hypothetical protein